MFDRQRMTWGPDYDLVVAGDSRAQVGLAPALLASGGIRAANFAFARAGYTPDYLEAVARRVDPSSPRRSILLAISPGALSPAAAVRNAFEESRDLHPVEALQIRHLGHVLEPFRRLTLNDLRISLYGTPGRSFRFLHPDGWLEVQEEDRGAAKVLKGYHHVFSRFPASPERGDALLDAARVWAARGIRVYGIRMPTAPELTELEDREGNLSFREFEERFRKAGGNWLAISSGRYATWDGSHLTAESARRLSLDLAERLR